MNAITLSQHARRRCHQRNISSEALHVALRYGQAAPRADGRSVFVLDEAGVRRAADEGVSAERHHGTTVVVAYDPVIVTAYWGER